MFHMKKRFSQKNQVLKIRDYSVRIFFIINAEFYFYRLFLIEV